MSADREPTADEVIAEALAQHLHSGRVNSRDQWTLCRCGERLPLLIDSDGYAVDPDEEDAVYAAHQADAAIAALKAAGFVVATRDEIRAMTPQEQAELVGGEVQRVDHPYWHDTGEPMFRGLVTEAATRRELRFQPVERVIGPWVEVQP